MKTGDTWLVQLDPTVGSEIQKTRPCVVISPDDMNAHLPTVIVAPMSTGSRPARFRLALTFQGKHGLIVLDEIRTLGGQIWIGADSAGSSCSSWLGGGTAKAIFVSAVSDVGRVVSPARNQVNPCLGGHRAFRSSTGGQSLTSPSTVSGAQSEKRCAR